MIMGAIHMREWIISSKEVLITEIRRGYKPDYLFFWGYQARRDNQIGKQCLSQWWPSNFKIGSVIYPTAEHYLMAEKARLFGDEDALAKILLASHPAEAKNLGRIVKLYSEDIWTSQRFAIAVRGNLAKFGQNKDIKLFLVGTGEKILVESSPVDRVWGIGLAEGDKRASDPDQWRGLNLLGFALMEARSRIQNE
jgi:ribA/ribD-fused uncharacterized protein